jgi:hypothetical protein
MSEAVSTHPSKAGKRWLNIILRILVGVLMVLAVVGLLVNVAGIVGVWAVHGPASSTVTDVAATMTHAIGSADNGLTRVNDQVQKARQALTQVNAEAANLGNRIQASSPVITRLSQLVDSNLAPRVDNANKIASAIRDAVVIANGALAVLNHLPGITVPPFNNELSSVSDHAQTAQIAVQNLRVKLADIKAGLVTNAEAAVTQLTSSIDTQLARIQALVNKYQATVAHAQERVSTISSTILTLINLLAVALTILFLIFAAGLLLLIYFCWVYVRNGRFPSLRITITP